MSLTPRGLIATAAIALIAGFAGVWLGVSVLARPHAPPSVHEVVHERLNLTAEQRTRIETLEDEFAARRRALELEMQSANAELAAAIRAEQGYGPRVRVAVEHFHDAMGRLQTETIAHIFAMRDVLDDEQKAIFDDTVVAALTSDPE